MNKSRVVRAVCAQATESSPVRRAWSHRASSFGWIRAVLVFFWAAMFWQASIMTGLAQTGQDYPIADSGSLIDSLTNDGGLFGGPVLQIIYAAESRGEVHPCFY